MKTIAWNNLKTTALLSGLIALCMGAGYLIGGSSGLFIGLILGGIGNIVAFWFSDTLALKAMRAQELSKGDLLWLFDAARQLAMRAEIPMPRLYLCPAQAPNAFATGRSPAKGAVAVTRGLLDHLSRDEIEGVIAHELAHIKHRDTLISTIAAILAGILSYAGHLFFFVGDRRQENPLGAIGTLLIIVVGPLVAMILQLAISRSREFAADAFAAKLCDSPNGLISALKRLESANKRVPMQANPAYQGLFIVAPLLSGEGVSRLFRTHPPTKDRIAALLESVGHSQQTPKTLPPWIHRYV